MARMTPPIPGPLPALHGVYAAAVTPLTAGLQLDLDGVPRLLEFLVGRGCHGVLLLGTTGEGTSLSVAERVAVVREAARFRDAAAPGLRLLAGTGCASLTDTLDLTRAAFDLGMDGVVVLPAFYYKGVTAEGLAAYYASVVQGALPADGRLLVYHIPQVSGVGVPPEAIAMLRARYPEQVWGMKDSQGDLAHTLDVTARFDGFRVFTGDDSLMTDTLAAGAAGAITALSGLLSPLNRMVWEAHRSGRRVPEAQERLNRARAAVKGYSNPAVLKAGLADLFGMPEWAVRPPLLPLNGMQRQRLTEALAALLEPLSVL
jgi:4-hydroxy-tetrahydrodipicolinate synthase